MVKITLYIIKLKSSFLSFLWNFRILLFIHSHNSIIGGGKQPSRLAGWMQLSAEVAAGPQNTSSDTLCTEDSGAADENIDIAGNLSSGAATTLYFFSKMIFESQPSPFNKQLLFFFLKEHQRFEGKPTATRNKIG